MCFVKNSTVTVLVGSPVEIYNRVPVSQARFPHFRVLERYYIESSKKRTDGGALW